MAYIYWKILMQKSLKSLLVLSAFSICLNSFADNNLPHMSAAQLKTFDGKNGHKAYVALNGYVYDVSNVDEWNGGHHYKGMVAGTDLSPYIHLSPHGPGIVKKEKLTPIAVYP